MNLKFISKIDKLDNELQEINLKRAKELIKGSEEALMELLKQHEVTEVCIVKNINAEEVLDSNGTRIPGARISCGDKQVRITRFGIVNKIVQVKTQDIILIKGKEVYGEESDWNLLYTLRKLEGEDLSTLQLDKLMVWLANDSYAWTDVILDFSTDDTELSFEEDFDNLSDVLDSDKNEDNTSKTNDNMNKLAKIKTLVQRHIDMTKVMEQMRIDMAEQALALLKEYNIPQIGLWSMCFTEAYDCDGLPRYSEDDATLFNRVELTLDQHDGNLWYGGSKDESEGKIIAIRNECGTLQFVCASDWNEAIYIYDVMDYVKCPEELDIDFTGVMDIMAKSIELNLQNNIPIEKWGVTHYPNANPYADEYLSDSDDEEADSWDDEEDSCDEYNQGEMTEAMKQVRMEVKQALALLKKYNIRQIGLWSMCFTEAYGCNGSPRYNEDDATLINRVKLTKEQHDVNLQYGCNKDNPEGKIIAIRVGYMDETLELVCASDWFNEIIPYDISKDDFDFPEELNIDFTSIVDIMAKSIELNLQNNIPIEKWGITHYPPVNPYADEYLLDTEDENDDYCDDDFMED